MSLVLGPGAVVAGRYRLDRLLGRGGMGQVWAVTHEVTLRTAALKFLNGPVHQRADRRRRFLREARAASAVQHPNVVQIHDFFELEDGTPVMIMDLLEGETLAQRFKRDGALPLASVVDLLLPVVSAVGTAHALGIVHRDLKPDNVFVTGTDGGAQVRVLDFGIAKLTASAVEDSDGGLTGTGAVLGTPRYMSPEQTVGDGSVDHRADIWSIGVMLYEALTGSRPIDGENVCRILQRLMNEGITPLRVLEPDLPEDVLALVERMLKRDPRGRPNDLREVADVLSPHGTVAVPAFGAAIAERELAPPSSPLSAPRSQPLAPPVSAVEEMDTLLDVPSAPRPGEPSADVGNTFAHALSVRKRARTRRWSFAAGVALVLAVGVLLRHAAREGAPVPALARGATMPQVLPMVDPRPAPPAVAEPSVPSMPVPEPRAAKSRLLRRAERNARAQPVVESSSVPAPASPAPRKASMGLVEEPPF
jgi:serine/threonine-protein kinase